MATLASHAEQSSIFEDPAHPFGPHGPTKTVPLWPLYYYKIYTSKGAYRKHILWPIYTRTVTPEQKINQILSFQNKYPRTFSNHTYVLWPIAGFQSSPKFGYNNWIFPILWQSNVKGYSQHNVVFPLYWYYKRNDGDTRILNIALLSHNFWGPGYHNHLLLPLAWTKWGHKRNFNGYSHLLFPLFYFNRDEELAEGQYGKTMHVLRDRAFITLFYRWYRDKIAPEGLAQVNDIGVFPLSFYKKENYLYYANGNIIRNKIFFLFPSFASIRFQVVRPDKTPETFEELDQTPGTQVLRTKSDFYFPLYLRSYGYEIIDSPDLRNVDQIPTEHDYRWIFPYYSFYDRNPVRSLELQELAIADDQPRDIFMPTRIQGNLDEYEKRTSGFPLLYHRSQKTWKHGTTKKLLVDQRFTYLFPYLSRYAKNKNAEGRQSSVMILAGWGNADLKIPDYPGYSQKYSFFFPLYYHSRRHSIGATPYSLDDKENAYLWLFPYYHSSKRIGKSIGRTDSVFPLAYMSDEEHARSNWWFGLLAGKFERQIPLQSKYDSEKYPVTIYEDEDPLDYTRKVSFLLPFWYSKYNLDSAFWMLFPFFGKSQSTPTDDTISRSTILPLAIARFKTSEKEDGSVQKRDFAAAYLYYRSSNTTAGDNETTRSSYWHAIPFYAKTVKPGHTRVTASIPPISYDHYTVPTENGRVNDSRVYASPHRWLPLFRTLRQTTGLPDGDPESILSSHWLFPFYSVRTNTFFDNTEKTAEDDKAEEAVAADTTAEAGKENTEEDAAQQEDDDEAEKHPKIKKYDRKTTVGAGLLYYNNLNDGLQKQFILSGIATTKKHDPLTFGTNSAFFGLFGKENRSWKTKKRFSPIYSKTVNQDNSSESSILFGMFGSKDTKSYHVSKIFFYPRVTPKMELDDMSEEEQLANEKKIRQQHLEFARQYAEMNYPEHAAVEFLLAEGEYENDLQLLRMAADQFALLDPDKLEKLLKDVPPHLLARTPAFSPDTFITYYPEEVYAKGADLYHKLLITIETDGAAADSAAGDQARKQDFNSVSLSLALLCYKYGKYKQCFDILRQRYEKTESKLEGLDMLHFYEDYAINHLTLSRTKPHHELTKELREKFPGDPILEFYHAKQELSPFKDAYLEDLGIPLLLDVLELNGENIQTAPEDRGQVLPMPSWPEPFGDVPPDGFPTFEQILRATHHELAMCYQSKLKTVRPDVFGIVRLSSIYAPNSVYAKQIRKQQMSMTDAERKEQTAVLINNIMLHLSQGTQFDPFRKTLETKELYPCRRIQSLVLQALKKDYETDLELNHYEPRRKQLAELDTILWLTSFDISFLRNWDATLVKGIPSDKGKGPLAVVADPNGFVDIDYAFEGIDNCTVEATTHFHNYFPRKLTLHLGFDHTLTVELNGEKVFGPSSQHIARRDQESVALDIPEGDISLKFIIEDDKLNYGFFARFTDEKGMPFFFNDLHQLNCKVCGDQIENWTHAITPQLKRPIANTQ